MWCGFDKIRAPANELVLVFCVCTVAAALARDDGRNADEPLHAWFDQLRSGGDFAAQNGHYRVRLQGDRVIIPDDAVVKRPNKFGRAVVWFDTNARGKT